jgi:hypothetical protein
MVGGLCVETGLNRDLWYMAHIFGIMSGGKQAAGLLLLLMSYVVFA